MRQDRFLTAILVGIAVLVVLAVALFFLRRGTLTYGPEDTPEGVARNYIVALKNNDYDRAYAYLANIKGKPDKTEFLRAMRQIQVSNISSSGVEVSDPAIAGDTAIVTVAIINNASGPFGDVYRQNSTGDLVKEGGVWKIRSMPYPFWDYSWTNQPGSAAP